VDGRVARIEEISNAYKRLNPKSEGKTPHEVDIQNCIKIGILEIVCWLYTACT
jgi:hypothetical protein